MTAMRGDVSELIIEELMADWPEDDAEIKDLKDRVLRNKFIPKLFWFQRTGNTRL